MGTVPLIRRRQATVISGTVPAIRPPILSLKRKNKLIYFVLYSFIRNFAVEEMTKSGSVRTDPNFLSPVDFRYDFCENRK